MNSIGQAFNGVGYYSTPSLTEWFHHATCSYEKFRKDVLDGKLDQLVPRDRQLLIDFVVRNEILHQAASINDQGFLETLIKNGADVNANDTDGVCVLYKCQSPIVFKILLEMGAAVCPFDEHFNFLLGRCTVLFQKKGTREAWFKILLELLQESTYEQKLSCLEHVYKKEIIIKEVVHYFSNRPELIELICAFALELCKKNPEIALDLLILLMKQEIVLESFLVRVEQNQLPDAFVEKVISHPKFIINAFDKPEVLVRLGNLRISIFVKGILGTNTLNEAAQICAKIQSICEIQYTLPKSITEESKQQMKKHIEKLQLQEKDSLWNHFPDGSLHLDDLSLLEQLGFDPNWEDGNKRTVLFTPIMTWAFLEPEFFGTTKTILSHVDVDGRNALEYHCLTLRGNELYRTTKSLVAAGLRITASFPHSRFCFKIFPHHPHFQALLAAYLNNPRNEFIDEIVGSIDRITEDPADLVKAIESPEVFQYLGKKKKEAAPNPFNNWSRHIPESASASKVISAILKQKELGKKVIKLQELFERLDHDGMIHLNRYFFDRPEIFQTVFKLYFKVKKMAILPGGGTYHTGSACVMSVMKAFEKTFNHVKKSKLELKKWHLDLLDAFYIPVAPVPVETLEIPPGAQLRRLGRTVVVSTNNETSAYKFLKPGEKYNYFSQEHSVTQAFKKLEKLFSTEFATPIGIYAVSTLPAEMAEFRDLCDRITLVYHYKGPANLFVYPQDLTPDVFEESRMRSLCTTVKMIKLGIYPDIIPLFHNDAMYRRYIPLIDLVISLTAYSNSGFKAVGGAGRLDQAFAKTLYPNIRGSGYLADLRDAQLLYGEYMLRNRTHELMQMPLISDSSASRFFYQMNALACTWLADMLIIIDRAKKDHILWWQNDNFITPLSSQLMAGFARISAEYSDQPYEKYLNFAQNCGINWLQMARQIAFWTDDSPNGYPSWIDRGELPHGLYDEHIKIEFEVKGAKNLTPTGGFATEGNQDIGVYNGPLALVTFEMAQYIFYHTIVMAEPLSN